MEKGREKPKKKVEAFQVSLLTSKRVPLRRPKKED